MEVNKDLINKVLSAKDESELIVIAKQEGLELSDELAKHYFEVLHQNEIDDNELENVSGGSQCISGKTYSSDPPYRLIVSLYNCCPSFRRCADGAEICGNCYFRREDGITTYCDARTVNNDPYR